MVPGGSGVVGLSKKENRFVDMDNSMVIARVLGSKGTKRQCKENTIKINLKKQDNSLCQPHIQGY